MSTYSGGKSLGGASGSAPCGDPRPLADKQYMMESAHRIRGYLGSKGFGELNQRTLLAPTSKDFFAAMQFLGQRAMPEFKVGNRPEMTVPALCRSLKYPFPINKSALQSVTAPHTWPAMLGLLLWLVELLQYEESADREFGAGDELVEDNSEEKVFFRYISRAYESFMAGEDDF